jgi:integrase
MTKTDAQTELDKIVIPLNEVSGVVEYTLQGFTRQVVFPWYERKWKASTAQTTEDRIDHHILKELGHRPLASFTRDHLQNLLDEKAKTGLSQATLSHLRWDLRQLFRMAVNEGLLARNPAELLHTPRGVRREPRFLTIDQAKLIFASVGLRDRLILKLAAIAGLRPGEVFGLTWADHTADGVNIRRRVYRGKIDTPKTHHSIRLAALGTTIEKDMAAWRLIAPNTKPEDWIFASEKKTTPLSASNFWRRNIQPALKPLGLSWVNFQVLRRSCSTLLNQLGTDGKTVADQLGHTLDVNQNVYTRTGIARQHAAVQQLDDALSHARAQSA